MLLLAVVSFIREDDEINNGIFGGNQPVLGGRRYVIEIKTCGI